MSQNESSVSIPFSGTGNQQQPAVSQPVLHHNQIRDVPPETKEGAVDHQKSTHPSATNTTKASRWKKFIHKHKEYIQ
jgi:hypothetical protein